MRKLLTAVILLMALCVAPVFAAEDTASDTASGQNEGYYIDVYSGDELTKILKRDPGANGPVTVRLGEPQGPYNSRIIVPENVTLDLNGQTVTGYVTLSGSGASIKNGTMDGAGIQIAGPDPVGNISGLRIVNAPSTAIYINSGSVVGNIFDNTIEGGGSYGIYLHDRATSGDITGNTIRNMADHAIRLSGQSGNTDRGCTAGDITDNTITNCKGSGISLYYGSECGVISRNTLTKIGGAHNDKGDYGIIVSAGGPYESSAKEITHNSLDTVTSAGIVVFSGPDKDTTGKWQDNGHVKGDIAYNTVKNCPTKRIANRTRAAIYVDNHARVYGSIHHNTVDKCIDNGISVISYAVAADISNNKISRVGTYGILAGNKGRIGRVSKNTITMNRQKDGMAILANTGSPISEISGNSIKGKYHTGIRIKTPKVKVTIKGNTLKTSNPKKKWSVGIACEKAKKLNITKNRITGNKTAPGIYLNKCTGKVKGNVFKKCSHGVYKAR